MYSYHLNKKKSQTFIKYYKEENDKINIYYGDGSVLETENTPQTKRNLNNIQEGQLDIEKPKYKGCFDEKHFLFFIVRIFSLAGLGTFGVLSLLTFPHGFFEVLGIGVLVGLPYLAPNIISYSKYLLNKISNMKFDLFMKYKNDLNSRVALVEEKIDSKSMNPVVERKSSILNLSINDVHFMKYSKLKKITDAIDKAKLQENRINSFSENKVKTLVKVKRNKGGYDLC